MTGATTTFATKVHNQSICMTIIEWYFQLRLLLGLFEICRKNHILFHCSTSSNTLVCVRCCAAAAVVCIVVCVMCGCVCACMCVWCAWCVHNLVRTDHTTTHANAAPRIFLINPPGILITSFAQKKSYNLVRTASVSAYTTHVCISAKIRRRSWRTWNRQVLLHRQPGQRSRAPQRWRNTCHKRDQILSISP